MGGSETKEELGGEADMVCEGGRFGCALEGGCLRQ